MKKLILISLVIFLSGFVLKAQSERTLFRSSSDSLFRIPVIASCPDGKIVVLSDYRHTHGSDVGFGRPIDILSRVSTDLGKNWEQAVKEIDCNSSSYADGIYGFGDASMVVDRKTGESLILCVGDEEGKSYGKDGRLQVHAFFNLDLGDIKQNHLNLTDQIYSLGDDWKSLFIASGKIFQSRVVKKGKYYRLYCSALVSGHGDYVLYSDDFGKSWSLLGDAVSPCPDGDEAKVEELPDGTVILSSRNEGRFFNFFRFDDRKFLSGHWQSPSLSEDIKAESNSTNGEILCLRVHSHVTGKREYLFLQSIPAGPDRSHVSIYYKAIKSKKECKSLSPESFGKGWNRYEVTDKNSAYSTMCLQKDGNIGFVYERTGLDVNGYDIVYESIPISVITSGAYDL